ncbi:response regulator [Herbivorax sp. ANBcel31]|uniref:response regulator n=1 Tax=Herbivorax sp. ANBcel31 TaxID=3069754 RepID=UPI0027B083C1|nr:response regulator [Herbivorax sp. ANBcel31]MDQ2084849.1 response regulator [Herbivorax sp. ANBcel31]
MNCDAFNKVAIILIDDERIVLNSLKSELSTYIDDKYAIEIAESSFEALELVDELLSDEYDIPVIICDYIMPEMKGDVLLNKIHQKSPHTLKILLTGQAVIDGVANAINNAELYKYFDKPWDKKDLKKAITEGIDLYYMKKRQQEDFLFLSSEEMQIKQKIQDMENSLLKERFLNSNEAGEIISHLNTLKEMYSTVLKLKNIIDSCDDIRISNIESEIDSLRNMLKIIET